MKNGEIEIGGKCGFGSNEGRSFCEFGRMGMDCSQLYKKIKAEVG